MTAPVFTKRLVTMAVVALSLTAARSDATAPPTVQFVDVADEAGLANYRHTSGVDQRYIVETSSGGAAFFDHDDDGDVDLYIVNGSRFGGFPKDQAPTNTLHRNDNGKFSDVTSITAVGDTSWSLGCAVADYDNDGHQDLYVANFGRNIMYRNRREGRFEEVTARAAVGNDGYSTGATFGDYDRDGDVDLYVANYIEFSLAYESTVPCVWKTYDVICGPQGMIPQADVFYRNEGNGTFSDATAAAGMEGEHYFGFQPVFADFTEDGWPDLFVADDMTPNKLFVNRGDGTFADRALSSGVGFDGDGIEQGCMGVGVGDYDDDGSLDIFVSNFEGEPNSLYRNVGGGFFIDSSYPSRVAAVGNPEVGWGTALFDFDNDGDKDIFVANGHTYPEADLPNTNAEYAQLNFLYENLGGGTFREISRNAGPGLAIKEVSRGAAFGDHDGDGDLDIFVLNLNSNPNLLRNDSGDANNYLLIETLGSASNRDGIGVRIEIEVAGRRQVAEVRSGGSYLGHDDMRAHFGLGQASSVTNIVLRWPSGAVQELRDVAANQVLTITEPSGAR